MNKCHERYSLPSIRRYDDDEENKESKKEMVEEFIKSYDKTNIVIVDGGVGGGSLLLDHSTTMVKKQLNPDFMSDDDDDDSGARVELDMRLNINEFERSFAVYHPNEQQIYSSQNDQQQLGPLSSKNHNFGSIRLTPIIINQILIVIKSFTTQIPAHVCSMSLCETVN